MSTMHLPKSIEHLSDNLKASDHSAWTVLALAIATGVAVLVAFYLR